VVFVSITDDRQLERKQSHEKGLQSVAVWPRTLVAQGCPVLRRVSVKSPRVRGQPWLRTDITNFGAISLTFSSWVVKLSLVQVQ